MCESFYMLESFFTFSYIFTMHKCTNSTCMHTFAMSSMHALHWNSLTFSFSRSNSFSHTPHTRKYVVDVFVNNFVTHRLVLAVSSFTGQYFLLPCKIFITLVFIPHQLVPQIDSILLLWRFHKCKDIVTTVHIKCWLHRSTGKPIWRMYNSQKEIPPLSHIEKNASSYFFYL